MTSKYKLIIVLLIFTFTGCSLEKLQNPLNISKINFNEDLFKKSTLLVLPPACAVEKHSKNVRMIFNALVKNELKNYKLILPNRALKLIKEKNLSYKLDKVFSMHGDEEDNVLFAAALGIDLQARFTLYTKITNIIQVGKRVLDKTIETRYNTEYQVNEEIAVARARYFRQTIVTGYFKIVDNERHEIVWAVENFKTMIEKLKGFKSVPLDDIMLKTYGITYMNNMYAQRGFPAVDRVIYRFFDRILSELP